MKNTYLSGILIGMIAPLLTFAAATYTTIQESFFTEKPLAIYVIAAVINLAIFRFTYRGGKESLAKGVLITTFIAMLVLIIGTRLKV